MIAIVGVQLNLKGEWSVYGAKPCQSWNNRSSLTTENSKLGFVCFIFCPYKNLQNKLKRPVGSVAVWNADLYFIYYN